MKIGIFGGAGKMGRMLIAAVLKTKNCELTAVCDVPGSVFIGKDAGDLVGGGETGVIITDNPLEMFAISDEVIDFSAPSASTENAVLAASTEKPLVIGTTGFSDEQQDIIHKASLQAPIVLSPNMSAGVNILLSIVEKTAAILDFSYDIEVLEMHHRNKVDAPSGTALALGRAAAKGRGVNLDEAMRASREGNIGKRLEGEIGFASLRGGDVVGDHTVIFAADGERIEFTHKASSREVFANGAVRAAVWLYDKPAGLYNMKDVLGL